MGKGKREAAIAALLIRLDINSYLYQKIGQSIMNDNKRV